VHHLVADNQHGGGKGKIDADTTDGIALSFGEIGTTVMGVKYALSLR